MAVTGTEKNPKKKVKVSKNRKKAWNKHCDIKDIEDFLEEKRLEERIGKVSEKPDVELFFVQKGTEQPAETKKINKPLKCHRNIGLFSDVTPPVNINVNRYPKRIKNVIQRISEKKLKKLVNKASEESTPIGQQSGDPLFAKDLWAKEDEEDNDYMKEIINFRDEYTKKRTPKVPCHLYQKPSLLPPVEVPHAGASYNPSFEDHQELLRQAVAVEEKRLKEQLHLKRVLDDMIPTKAEAPTEASVLAEMSQGLFDEENENEEEEKPENQDSFMLRNAPVCASDRLTRSRKRRRKEIKEEAKRRMKEKLNKRRLHEVYRIPSIRKEIKKDGQVSEQKQEKRLKKQIEKAYKPSTLSKYKYEAPDIEVNLTQEVTGSLRTLKTDGNLMEDRYKSFQRRNLIETRIKQKFKRKYKLKKQVKRSHRNFE